MTETQQDVNSILDLSYHLVDIDIRNKDFVEALRLIADSVAQQRQQAARAIIFHPLIISVLVLALSIAIYARPLDLSLLLTTGAGVLMAGLVAVRWLVSGYITAAENIDLKWLERGACNDCANSAANLRFNGPPIVSVASFGPEIIGVLLIDRYLQDGEKTHHISYRIRAWTVKLKYRGRGIGSDLLEHAATRLQSDRDKDGRLDLKFASNHANSLRILPSLFNGSFDKTEAHAQRLLELFLQIN